MSGYFSFWHAICSYLIKQTEEEMRNLVFILIALGVAVVQVYAKKVNVDFINTQDATCAVYLDDEYLGRMKAGDNLHKRIKKGDHKLSFVVFDEKGNYYTYVRELNIEETNSKFLLLSNDTGLVHIEKYRGVNPMVVRSIVKLPAVDEGLVDQTIMKMQISKFELHNVNMAHHLINEHRLSTHNLRDLLDQIQDSTQKAQLAKIAYQHIIDKHNFHHILFDMDEETVKMIQKHTAMVNKYI